MPRSKVVITEQLPYHISARVNDRKKFPGNPRYVWRVFESELFLLAITKGIRVHAFVLMPNHFHLMVTTPEFSISDVMRCLISSSTRTINAKNSRTGHLFGGRYNSTVVSNPFYYAHVLKYVYRNPVKAGLREQASDYEFSTLFGLLGSGRLSIPILRPLNDLDRFVRYTEDFIPCEEWLNVPHQAEESEAIHRALLRKKFKLPVDQNSKRPIKLGEL